MIRVSLKKAASRFPLGEVTALRHVGGAVSHLWMNTLTPLPGPRFRIVGSEAGFLSWGLDPQEAALKGETRRAHQLLRSAAQLDGSNATLAYHLARSSDALAVTRK